MARVPGLKSPLLLGFENFERILDNIARNGQDGYPPYNIEQVGSDGLRISVAVAGFALDDLSVSVENNQLVLRGRKREDDPSRVFLHRGIASRQFQRTFLLADGIEITGATLDNGLLHVDLRRRQPEPEVKTIRIDRGGRGKSAASADVSAGTSPPQQIEVTPEP
jgi:HSP20 family molecular chaperone IbpA